MVNLFQLVCTGIDSSSDGALINWSKHGWTIAANQLRMHVCPTWLICSTNKIRHLCLQHETTTYVGNIERYE